MKSDRTRKIKVVTRHGETKYHYVSHNARDSDVMEWVYDNYGHYDFEDVN